MKELLHALRRVGQHLFEILAVFAVGYVLVLLLLVLVEFEAKLNIADRVVYYLKVFPWGGS